MHRYSLVISQLSPDGNVPHPAGRPAVQGDGGAVPPAQVLLLTTSKPGVIVITEPLGDGQKKFTSISEKTN